MSKKLKYIMSADITKDDLYGEKLRNKQQIVAYLTKFKAVTRSGPRAFTDIITGLQFPSWEVYPFITEYAEAYTAGTWCWTTEEIYYFIKYDAKLDPDFLAMFA